MNILILSVGTRNKIVQYFRNEFKNKGIAQNASKLLIEYAFNTLNLNKIYLYTEENNAIAQRVFEKIGFQKEG